MQLCYYPFQFYLNIWQIHLMNMNSYSCLLSFYYHYYCHHHNQVRERERRVIMCIILINQSMNHITPSNPYRHRFRTSAGHRGLCWFPHAAALCTSRHVGGMGGIKPTTEALRPGELRSGAFLHSYYYNPNWKKLYTVYVCWHMIMTATTYDTVWARN